MNVFTWFFLIVALVYAAKSITDIIDRAATLYKSEEERKRLSKVDQASYFVAQFAFLSICLWVSIKITKEYIL